MLKFQVLKLNKNIQITNYIKSTVVRNLSGVHDLEYFICNYIQKKEYKI